jgi:hypothetical protein
MRSSTSTRSSASCRSGPRHGTSRSPRSTRPAPAPSFAPTSSTPRSARSLCRRLEGRRGAPSRWHCFDRAPRWLRRFGAAATILRSLTELAVSLSWAGSRSEGVMGRSAKPMVAWSRIGRARSRSRSRRGLALLCGWRGRLGGLGGRGGRTGKDPPGSLSRRPWYFHWPRCKPPRFRSKMTVHLCGKLDR